jgi:UDP-N-acetylglucosamine 2-epimerase (non-hydrolysing)
MIDSLLQNTERLRQPEVWKMARLSEKEFFLITLHRPGNVDNPSNLQALLKAILDNTGNRPVLFPVHPRTRKILDNISFSHERLIQLDPLGYLEFIYLVKQSRAVITDSGGITEEATVLGVPCMTLRNSTERPETVTIGTNELVGTDPANLVPYLQKLATGHWKKGSIPPLWDGKSAERIVARLLELYGGH